MVALTILAAPVMQQVSPENCVSVFADNWAVIVQTIKTLADVISALEGFVSDLDMRLSPGKSWTWETSPSLRKELKQVRMCGV